ANKFVASDGGHFIGVSNTYFDLESRDSIVLLGTAFQSIGLGFPTAVGVATAAGQQRLTVLVTGNGGDMMALTDAFLRTECAHHCQRTHPRRCLYCHASQPSDQVSGPRFRRCDTSCG